jgi:endogenous inhibitor of DNA gyrase (YacG/DUF329 family)
MAHAKCPTCDRRIELTEKHFGRKVQCSCGKVLRIPAKKTAAAPAPPALSKPIQFSCPTCMTLLEVGAEMAGKPLGMPLRHRDNSSFKHLSGQRSHVCRC